jgi:hypothetical protein
MKLSNMRAIHEAAMRGYGPEKSRAMVIRGK